MEQYFDFTGGVEYFTHPVMLLYVTVGVLIIGTLYIKKPNALLGIGLIGMYIAGFLFGVCNEFLVHDDIRIVVAEGFVLVYRLIFAALLVGIFFEIRWHWRRGR